DLSRMPDLTDRAVSADVDDELPRVRELERDRREARVVVSQPELAAQPRERVRAANVPLEHLPASRPVSVLALGRAAELRDAAMRRRRLPAGAADVRPFDETPTFVLLRLRPDAYMARRLLVGGRAGVAQVEHDRKFAPADETAVVLAVRPRVD